MELEACRKQYFDSVRNLSPEQIALVESGGPCESPQMAKAQEFYRAFKALESQVVNRGADDHSFMMQI